MGLIKAIGGAIRGTMADQWKEYFYCDAMEADVVVTDHEIKCTDGTEVIRTYDFEQMKGLMEDVR